MESRTAMLNTELAAAFRAHAEGSAPKSVFGVLRDAWIVCDLVGDSAEIMPVNVCLLLRLPFNSTFARGSREMKVRIIEDAEGRPLLPSKTPSAKTSGRLRR